LAARRLLKERRQLGRVLLGQVRLEHALLLGDRREQHHEAPRAAVLPAHRERAAPREGGHDLGAAALVGVEPPRHLGRAAHGHALASLRRRQRVRGVAEEHVVLAHLVHHLHALTTHEARAALVELALVDVIADRVDGVLAHEPRVIHKRA
ncbi:MAG: hypothetical protein CL844_03845, partial [Crocinitomicaceae bacterium]|nr:hypothetical protein [Crocinitomicaceae bacterium]